MIGLVLLYWVGKYFYELAKEYNKNKWKFTILGVVVYYAGILLSSFILGTVMGIITQKYRYNFLEITFQGFIDNFNGILLGLLMLPFGFLSSYVLYKYLKETWKENNPTLKKMIEDIGE